MEQTFLHTKPFPVSMHTNRNSNSVILRNDLDSLLSDLCTCIQVKEMALQMKTYSSSYSDQFELPCDTLKLKKKSWDGALLSVKCRCFV